MPLTIQDLKVFQAQHLNHRLELVNGEIIVMAPCGYESDEMFLELDTTTVGAFVDYCTQTIEVCQMNA